MNRALAFIAAAMLLAGPAAATTKKPHVSCAKVRSELSAGKKPAEVASDLNISEAKVMHCSPKVASTKHHTKSGHPQPAPAQPQ
jgi:hypothetical protein